MCTAGQSSESWSRGAASEILMLEVAVASDNQGHAVLVAYVHSLLVAHGATGVRDGLDTSLARDLNRVAPREGEERITC